MSDKSVRDIGERRLNRLLVLRQGAFPLGFRQLDVRSEAPGGKDRLRDLWDEVPRSAWAAEQV